MFKGKRTLRDFEKFMNPDNLVLSNYYDYLDFNCLEYCSYIHYIVLDNFDSKPYNVLNLDEIKKCLNNGCKVIAFNHLDYSIMEVRL